MRLETPDAGRAQFSKNADSIQIVLPSPKNLAAVVFLGFWLCGWALGELFAIGELASLISSGIEQAGSSELFIFVWLCGWTIGGAFAISSFLWSLFGRECLGCGPFMGDEIAEQMAKRCKEMCAERSFCPVKRIDAAGRSHFSVLKDRACLPAARVAKT